MTAPKRLPVFEKFIQDVRAERLAGRTLQGRYDPEKNRFAQGQGPTQVAFEIS